ncbi:threonine dehydrogenase-like Zn-dependent dehydrogenase [Solirubrobacter pauli]|uniref:Threonine dehydrogenase-like Zn-dependent dehydrogenase n=1 Tax=Solirubrobacter pauli TaxID=166793 RepID=A0A660L8I7_9ACTN|nr:glucose 1-dehydrogenase [Solirubrobacter pauli]RKQ90223.1 threonine dehydrogenase-like Zn-dependent dehydrogenase [Solirubrobacter pauli]
MRALTVEPGTSGTARVEDVPEPPAEAGAVLVAALALGICGTDREIAAGEYGWAPEGRDRLILGHESLGRVLDAPDDAPVAPGDLVAGVVRRPDPQPCECCAAGRFDLCRNGEYTERGIKAIDGYGSERWRVEPEYAVRLDPSLERVGVLIEPTSVVAKAWDELDAIYGRLCARPRTAVITGAGPIGLLAALLAVQRGLETHVLDVVSDGLKPELVDRLGATYHAEPLPKTGLRPDVVVECTGVGQVVFDAMACTAAPGVVCLTGVSPKGRSLEVDAGALNRALVLENDTVFGSVNAAHRHYRLAAEALQQADHTWLERLLTRRVPLEDAPSVLGASGDDIKVVIEF